MPFRGPGADEAAGPPDDEDEARTARLANRFDIRRIIGGVFLVYSVILILTGVFGSEEVKTKASGINVDLWTGLAMLVVGALMVAWALLRPVAEEPPKTRGHGSGRSRRAPAT